MDKEKALQIVGEIEADAPHYADPREGVKKLAGLVRELIEAPAPAPAPAAKKARG